MTSLNRCARAVLACCLMCLALPARAQQAAGPEDAVVLIRTHTSLRQGRGSGFLIGDGSWVVTASHVVSTALGKGRWVRDETVLVYSPWTGRPYEAKVVAVDGVADIALLRLPQSGLPALAVEGLDLKDPNAALSALKDRPLRLYGFPLAYGEDTVAALAKPEKNDSQLREVAKRGETNLCVLNACPNAQPGWSGGPVVSADRGTVVAVFHSLYRPKPGAPESYPAGSLSGYLGDVLRSAGVTDLSAFTRTAPPTVPRPANAGERMALEMRAMSWSAGARWKKAEEEQREILKLAPEDGLAHLQLGIVLLAQKKDEAALKAMQEAARLAPRSVLANLYLARTLNYNYEAEAAVKTLKAVMEAAPAEVEPQLALAEVYEANRQTEPAEATLRKALEKAPEHPAVLYRLGNLLCRAGPAGAARADEGLKLLARAAELSLADPSLVFVQFGYARALENARKLGEAEARYRLALRQDPEYGPAYYYLAQLYLRLKRIDDAQVYLNSGLNVPHLSDELLQAFRALQVRINDKSGGVEP